LAHESGPLVGATPEVPPLDELIHTFPCVRLDIAYPSFHRFDAVHKVI